MAARSSVGSQATQATAMSKQPSALTSATTMTLATSMTTPMSAKQVLQGLFQPIRYIDLEVKEEIGRGRFKRVSKATLKDSSGSGEERDVVMLKYMKKCEAREMQIISMLANNEDSQPYVPEIYGASVLKKEAILIQEWAPYGSMKSLMSNAELASILGVEHKIYAASQISSAIAFLASLRIVHNDLAARNVLVFHLEEQDPASTRVKITDFGLALELEEGEDSTSLKQPQAVRWCAPETVAHAKLSCESDMWMLGMTLWEIFSGGQSPWPNHEKRADISQLLTTLGNLEPGEEPPVDFAEHFQFSQDWPQEVGKLMMCCLALSEEDRPPAQFLGEHLHHLVEPPTPEPEPERPARRRVLSILAPKMRKLKTHSTIASNPDSIKRIMENSTVLAFADWASGNWGQLHEIFKEAHQICGARHNPNGGVQPSTRISREQWAKFAWLKGFRGDPHAVFDAISMEVLVKERPDRETISLAQLKRFEAKAQAATSLAVCADMSAAGRFTRYLKQKRGSALRGWRLDVDKRGTGHVAFSDFVNACRELGMTGQARSVWDCVRCDGNNNPIQFHEMDTDEVQNMEDFVDALVHNFGRDLEAAWAHLDTKRRNLLTEEEFTVGVKKMGYTGNVKLLYKGLDSKGLGRLTRSDFSYMWKVSGRAHDHGNVGSSMAQLVEWLSRERVRPDDFLEDLGLANRLQDELDPADLSARLTAVGFTGHATKVAAEVLAETGSRRISVGHFRDILAGNPAKELEFAPPARRRTSSCSLLSHQSAQRQALTAH